MIQVRLAAYVRVVPNGLAAPGSTVSISGTVETFTSTVTVGTLTLTVADPSIFTDRVVVCKNIFEITYAVIRLKCIGILFIYTIGKRDFLYSFNSTKKETKISISSQTSTVRRTAFHTVFLTIESMDKNTAIFLRMDFYR